MRVGTGLSVTVAALHTCPVKAPVCLSRELGVMQPGQTVVELSADGVCHTSRCTEVLDPLTGFYQINTTSVLCDVHCEAVGGSAGWRCVGRGGLAWQSLGAPGIRGALRACPKEALRDLWGKRWGRSWSGRGKERNSKSDGLAKAGIWGFDRVSAGGPSLGSETSRQWERQASEGGRVPEAHPVPPRPAEPGV